MRPNAKSASSTGDEDRASYSVVVNHEEQYSIWPTNRECPAGWKGVGKTGFKSTTLPTTCASAAMPWAVWRTRSRSCS